MKQVSKEIEVVYAELPPTNAPEISDFDFYEGCDVTKTCFGVGDDYCVPNRRCSTVGAVIHNEGKFIFEMLAPGEKFESFFFKILN